MSLTPSHMKSLGSKAPDFNLLNTVDGQNISLSEAKGLTGTVIMFICVHCPFVKHVNTELAKLAKDYQSKGIGFIAISSNDIENYPQDRPEKMKEQALEHEFVFPYLYDQTQEVAKAYQAACTPDFFVYDEHLQLVYRGQLDDSRPNNGIPVTGNDMRRALNALIEGKPIDQEQKPSIGCNIKWK